MQQPYLSLVVPVYNAAPRLPTTLSAIDDFRRRAPVPLEVVFVDDCSSDGETAGMLDRYAAVRQDVTVLHNACNRGKGYSVARGMLAATGAYRVFTDVDLAYPLSEVPKILSTLEAGEDVAIACRVLPESRYLMSPTFFHYLYTRHLMSRGFNLMVRFTLLPGVLDSQAGLKGFTATAARRVFSRATIPGFGFDIECLFVARRLGLTIKQVAVEFRYDEEPTTVRLVRDSVRMLRDIVTVGWQGWTGRYTSAAAIGVDRGLTIEGALPAPKVRDVVGDAVAKVS
jgi:dolichyl-phosphate beta-glucosyltransferase